MHDRSTAAKKAWDTIRARRAAAAAAGGVASNPAPTRTRIHVRTSRPKIQKVFADFLESRCQNLALAARVLGITPRPPIQKQALRSAWIALIALHHPDKGGDVQAAQAVNAAYQLLSRFAQ